MEEIIAKFLEGRIIHQIALDTSIPVSTIWAFQRRFKERASDNQNPKSPGRLKMGKKKRESSIECMKNNHFIPKVEISMQVDVSIPAIKKVLKEDEWKFFGISFVFPF